MQKVDMEKIIAEVERSAGERNYPENIPQFEEQYIYNTNMFISYESQVLEENVKNLTEYAMVSESTEYFERGFKGIFKRIIIKLVRFYVLPVVERQNLFNGTVKEVGTQLYASILIKDKQVEELQAQVEELKQQIEKMKSESRAGQ